MTNELPLRLKVSRSRAEEVLDRHLADGEALLSKAQTVSTEEEFREWDDARHRWEKLTQQGIETVFDGGEPVEEFQAAHSTPMVIGGVSEGQEFEWKREAVQRGTTALKSLSDRFEYLEAPGDSPLREPESEEVVSQEEKTVFVVHGRDEGLKSVVVRLLEKTGKHEVIVLHEQVNAGRTLIEKFEDHARRSDFAVVLLTPDDEGGLAGPEGTTSPRARQNVVFEMGFFVGRLGRSRVAVLYDSSVELPSDYSGVAFTPIEDGNWKFGLLAELRAAGLDFDLNKVPT